MTFILMRLAGYGAVLAALAAQPVPRPWWQWAVALAVAAWGVWARYKRPDDPPERLRLGAWAELVLILVAALVLQEATVLFLLLSPLVRTGVHLPWRDALLLGLVSVAGAVALQTLPPHHAWVLWAQLAALLSMGPYACTIGDLLRQRDQARRLAAVAGFEREQRLKDDERIRIAQQLHDVMGQYWTAVIRALDAAAVTDGETSRQFVSRARETAMTGLQEMRTAVHDWHQGRQTPEQWLQFAGLAIRRCGDLPGLQISERRTAVDWSRFADPTGAAEAVARLIAEGLTNAVRHGGATAVAIDLQADGGGITTRISDNGRGLPEHITPGVGTRAMERLAHDLGGTWAIAPGARGTVLTMALPYAGAAASPEPAAMGGEASR